MAGVWHPIALSLLLLPGCIGGQTRTQAAPPNRSGRHTDRSRQMGIGHAPQSALQGWCPLDDTECGNAGQSAAAADGALGCPQLAGNHHIWGRTQQAQHARVAPVLARCTLPRNPQGVPLPLHRLAIDAVGRRNLVVELFPDLGDHRRRPADAVSAIQARWDAQRMPLQDHAVGPDATAVCYLVVGQAAQQTQHGGRPVDDTAAHGKGRLVQPTTTQIDAIETDAPDLRQIPIVCTAQQVVVGWCPHLVTLHGRRERRQARCLVQDGRGRQLHRQAPYPSGAPVYARAPGAGAEYQP